jgi:hypothetical protein
LRSIAAADADAGLRDKFRADGVVTYSGLRGYAEKRGIKANELQAFLVREAKELRLAWWEPGVSGADKAYVLATDDEHRDVVLGMFCDRQTIKRADALETCRTKTGKELPATYVAMPAVDGVFMNKHDMGDTSTSPAHIPRRRAWTRIMKEIGARKGGNWELRLTTT